MTTGQTTTCTYCRGVKRIGHIVCPQCHDDTIGTPSTYRDAERLMAWAEHLPNGRQLRDDQTVYPQPGERVINGMGEWRVIGWAEGGNSICLQKSTLECAIYDLADLHTDAALVDDHGQVWVVA